MLDQIRNNIEDLSDDSFTSKNIKEALNKVLKEISNTQDVSIAVSRSVSIIEELTEDVNIDPMIRTRLMQIIGELESVQA